MAWANDSVSFMSKGANAPALVWLRQDLRLRDNPALQAAAEHGSPIVPLYILCDAEEQVFPPGAAARWWLHRVAARTLRRISASSIP
jgi:deoxyribodipyrimidine photo-lyase